MQRQYSEQEQEQRLPRANVRERDLCDFRKRNGCIAGMQGCPDGTSRDDPRNLNDHLAELRKQRQRHALGHLHQSMPDLSEPRRRPGHARSASQQRGNPRAGHAHQQHQ